MSALAQTPAPVARTPGGLRIGRAAPAASIVPAPAPSAAAANEVPEGDGWLARWCRTPSIEERLAMINELSGKRLPSPLAAEVWLQLQAKATPLLTPADSELLLRQFLTLAPEHARAPALYDLLMNGQPVAAEPAPGIVFMITSCERYQAQAERVLADLQQRGAQACIVVGDPGLTVAVDEGTRVRLPVSDSYEALLSKVLEGLAFVRRRHGPVAVAKIDDDMRLHRGFDPEALARLARTLDYAGSPIGDYPPDRCWHLGKTSVPTPIFTRRHHGRFAYGPMYLLGPRAVEHLVREWVFYPGEFAGEIYEDRAVGNTLRRAGFDLRPLTFTQMGGVVDETERLLPARG